MFQKTKVELSVGLNSLSGSNRYNKIMLTISLHQRRKKDIVFFKIQSRLCVCVCLLMCTLNVCKALASQTHVSTLPIRIKCHTETMCDRQNRLFFSNIDLSIIPPHDYCLSTEAFSKYVDFLSVV